MSDFVTPSNKFFCSHFKELEEYVKEKGLKLATIKDIRDSNYYEICENSPLGFETIKQIGKFFFSTYSYNYRGVAKVICTKETKKGIDIKEVTYISGIKTLKSAIVVTCY